jgi:hypothetical protein
MLSGLKEESLFHEDKKTEIRQIRRSITPNAFSRWQSVFNDYLKSANHPLNRRLALEALFLKWPQT